MVPTTFHFTFRNPPGYDLDFDLLREFEYGLNPSQPEEHKIPSRVLGYGEISTAFTIETDTFADWALKRMSIFETAEEFATYLSAYDEYHHLLEEEIGIQLPVHGYAAFVNENGRPIFYIIQQKADGQTIGNNALAQMSEGDAKIAFHQILREMHKVWAFNQQQEPYQVALDGQISNWVIVNFSPEKSTLLYIDTSTPIYRQNGTYQFDTELLLRAAPSFMRWILRYFFLEDVVTRYYDERKIVIDLLGNLYKEKLGALVPSFITIANQFFVEEMAEFNLEPIRTDEVEAYYKEDKLIWELYLSMRRFDRFAQTKLLRKQYPYILPGKVNR